VTEELHVVDVKRRSIFWEVHLSNGKVMHVAAARYPDELGAFTYVTNKLKEQSDGTNSRA
jgi:hypothetical protein